MKNFCEKALNEIATSKTDQTQAHNRAYYMELCMYPSSYCIDVFGETCAITF